MDYRVGRMHQAIVVVSFQSKPLGSEIAAKNADPGLEVFVELRERHVQLPCAP